MSEVWRVKLRLTLHDQLVRKGGELQPYQCYKVLDIPVEQYPTARKAESKARRVLKKMFGRCVLRRKSIRKVTK